MCETIKKPLARTVGKRKGLSGTTFYGKPGSTFSTVSWSFENRNREYGAEYSTLPITTNLDSRMLLLKFSRALVSSPSINPAAVAAAAADDDDDASMANMLAEICNPD